MSGHDDMRLRAVQGLDAARAYTSKLERDRTALKIQAQVLYCLATSPRFQTMTVAAALAELEANGMGHDGGAALAKANGG